MILYRSITAAKILRLGAINKANEASGLLARIKILSIEQEWDI